MDEHVDALHAVREPDLDEAHRDTRYSLLLGVEAGTGDVAVNGTVVCRAWSDMKGCTARRAVLICYHECVWIFGARRSVDAPARARACRTEAHSHCPPVPPLVRRLVLIRSLLRTWPRVSACFRVSHARGRTVGCSVAPLWVPVRVVDLLRW